MYKNLFLISLIFVCASVFATDTITFVSESAVIGKTEIYGDAISALQTTGDGKTLDNAVKLYFPMLGVNDGGEYLSRSEWGAQVVKLPSATDAGAVGQAFVIFELYITSLSGEQKYLNAAIKNSDGTFATFNLPAEMQVTGGTEVLHVVTIDLNQISSGISGAVGSNSAEKDLMFFLHSEVVSRPSFASSDYSVSVFLKANFSDQLPQNSLIITNITKGDGRLFIDFKDSYPSVTLMDENNYYRTLVFDNSIIIRDDIFTKKGSVNLNQLTNGQTYNISMSLQNKFKVFSAPSNVWSETPESIETFLKKNACYLISAGFKREHPVLNFFREIRDHYLLQSRFGRFFVNWYYATAPNYATYIANSWVLSFLVVCLSTLFYLCWNFWYLLLIPVASVTILAYSKKKC